jgi:hypothetical protein
MNAQPPASASPTHVARLMVTGALSAVSCADGIQQHDDAGALLHLKQLRSALEELERLAPRSNDVAVLRRHERRLSERVAALPNSHARA